MNETRCRRALLGFLVGQCTTQGGEAYIPISRLPRYDMKIFGRLHVINTTANVRRLYAQKWAPLPSWFGSIQHIAVRNTGHGTQRHDDPDRMHDIWI